MAERKLLEARCKSLLVEKIADSQLDYIKGESTPKAIWATLQNVFATKGIFVLPTEATGRDYVTAKQNR